MQILRRIKSWYGRGNSAWDGNNGLDADLVHIDNHLPNITYAGIVTLGTATSATAAAVPGRAQLFADGTYAVTNRDIGGSLVVQAYTPIAGALASNGTAVLVNTGSAWVNIFAAMPAGITITGAQVIGAVASATYALNADYALEAGHALTADALATVGAVPTTKMGDVIVVNAPHLRHMVWNGTAYVRAPWHQPGMVQYSIDNPASIPGYLPVRGDVVYSQSNYPDLIARLGLSGVGNFSLVELRGEFIRCLDNGRGVDAGRVSGSAQTDQFRQHQHTYGYSQYATSLGGTGGYVGLTLQNGSFGNSYLTDTLGAVLPGGLETRPRNVALPAWVSY